MEALAAADPGIPYLRQAVILLFSSVIAVSVLHRLRLSPVLGYLVAGLAIGPSGLSLVEHVENVRTVAELGVVFLLFMMGLDLSFERLKSLRRLVFGLGGLQVLLSAGAVAAVVYVLGFRGPELVVIGGALALSSTAVVLQVLIERGEMASRLGRVCFAVLLLQDLAVVPLLVVVNVLGSDAKSLGLALAVAFAKAAAAVALILVVGRYALRAPLRAVAATRSSELFMAFALLVVLGTGWLTHAAGLSMALGAFLAGLLLAETEFRHQVETDIGPFKGLLIGLFFMAVGMSIDADVVAGAPFALLGAVIGLIALKATIVAVLCRLFGLPHSVALRAGFLLGPGGEFAFVIITTAIARGVLDDATAQFLLAATALSILLTPVLAALSARLAARFESARARHGSDGIDQASEAIQDHVVIAGFGRVGQTVATLLGEQEVSYVAVDLDPARVKHWRERGVPVYYGDASREDILEKIGLSRAAALIITIDDPEAARRTLANIRRKSPRLPIFVRAHDASHLKELQKLGAAAVVPETLESSLTLARHALEALGTPAEAAERLAAEVRAIGYAGEPAGKGKSGTPT